MQTKSPKTLHNIVLEFPRGGTRTVKIKASSPEVAERRALKFHPNAIGVKANGS